MVFSVDLLGAWYGARAAQSLALNSARTAAPVQTASGAQRSSDVLPPWDPRGEIVALETLRRDVLADGRFFDSRLSAFSDLDVSEDEKKLFALHQGIRKLQALSSAAGEKTASDTDRAFWSRRFTEGLAQLDSFFEGLDLEGVSVVKGEDLAKAESALAIKRGESRYVGGAIHEGAFDAEVAGLTGDVRFTISVRKNGVDTPIAVDLADMGATPRTLDNVAAHVNTQLEAAGMISRIERVKIGTPDENGVIAGNSWGFEIKGVLTEKVSFTETAGAPAVWTAGVSGADETAGGQLVRWTDLASGGSFDFARRIEADPTVTETTTEDGETKTSTTSNPLTVVATARGADGAIYVVGRTNSAVDGQAIKGEQDLVLQRWDSTGKKIWTRTLGAAGSAEGASVAVDASGNVIVAGSVTGALGETTALGGSDSLVVKYTAEGVEQWARRFGGTADDRANAVSVGADGTVYVSGEAKSAIGGVQSQGGTDGYVRAIAADGTTLYTRAAEAGAGTERVRATTMAADGGLIVASEVDGRAVITKYAAGDDGTGAPVWRRDLGSLDGGRIGGVAADADGGVYLSGSAGAAFASGAVVAANQGGRDAFLVRLADTGAVDGTEYTSFLGTADEDAASSVAVSNGKVYLAGKTTGALPGGTLDGARNAFAAGFDALTGAREWSRQISGRGGLAEAAGVVVDPTGDGALSKMGFPSRSVVYSDTRVITARSSVREGDFFYVSVDGGRKKKIEIAANETMRSLSFKLNAALVLDGTADVRRSKDGDMLRITPKEGVTITLSRGSEGRDALQGLGLPEGTVRGKPSLLDGGDTTADAPKVFALELPARLSILDRDAALAATEALTEAQSKIQRAYRELTIDPALKALLDGPQAGKRGGTVPAYLSAQVANYQAGLQRLLGGGGGSSTLGLF
ncbi:MAG: hypothetical protein ABL308_00780 [Oceanicaulis sp.]